MNQAPGSPCWEGCGTPAPAAVPRPVGRGGCTLLGRPEDGFKIKWSINLRVESLRPIWDMSHMTNFEDRTCKAKGLDKENGSQKLDGFTRPATAVRTVLI